MSRILALPRRYVHAKRRRASRFMNENKKRAPAPAARKCPDCERALVEIWCAHCGWHPEERQIDPREREFREIAFDVWNGTAASGDARRLLEAFCAPVESRDPSLDRFLTEHLRLSLRRYLSGEYKLEAALGLKHRFAGQPRVNAAIRQEIAAALLRHQLGLCRA